MTYWFLGYEANSALQEKKEASLIKLEELRTELKEVNEEMKEVSLLRRDPAKEIYMIIMGHFLQVKSDSTGEKFGVKTKWT